MPVHEELYREVEQLRMELGRQRVYHHEAAAHWRRRMEELRAALVDLLKYVPEQGAMMRAGYGPARERARMASEDKA